MLKVEGSELVLAVAEQISGQTERRAVLFEFGVLQAQLSSQFNHVLKVVFTKLLLTSS